MIYSGKALPEKGILQDRQAMLVRSKPPWVSPAVWSSLKGQHHGVVIDYKDCSEKGKHARLLALARHVAAPWSNCEFDAAGEEGGWVRR